MSWLNVGTTVQLSYEVCLQVNKYHKVKAELDGMYAFLGNVLENNSVVIQYKDEDGAGRDRGSALKDHISQLQGCVHMFDQDYVMKVYEYHIWYNSCHLL